MLARLSRGAAEGAEAGTAEVPRSSKAEPWELWCKDIRNLMVSKDFTERNFALSAYAVKIDGMSMMASPP